MNDTITRRPVDGAYKLALRFPSGALKGAGAALAAAMNEEGRAVPPDGPSAVWRFENAVQDAEGGLLLGPDFEGRSVEEASGIADGLRRLHAIARALALLASEGRLPRGLAARGLLASEAGEVLLLPPIAAARAFSARGAQARDAELPQPKGLGGSEAEASFLLAKAAYRLAAGEGHPIPAGIAAPRLHPDIAALVDAALADPGSVTLAAWVAALESARAAGWTRELPPEEEAELARRRASLEAEAQKKRRREAFFRKRGGLIIAGVVAVAVVAMVAGDMIRAQRDKPDFSWLSPRELVQRYYLALDGLDLEALEACGTKKAIKSDSGMMTNLVVITKTRLAYEGKSPVVHAQDWVAAGKPELKAEDFLYGIVGLTLSGGESVPAGAASLAIKASYSFWTLDRREDPSGDPSKSTSFPSEERRIDELRLDRGEKGGWKIASLERGRTLGGQTRFSNEP